MPFLPRKKISPSDIKLYKSLGSLIKDYRQWRELTQETFAESIGVSVRELQNWEADRRRVRFENLHDLSEVTGIPMQVCVALNADQPLWYSLQKRRFAYSSIEIAQLRINDILKCQEQSEDGAIAKYDRITTDKHIRMILSCHRDIYGTEEVLGRDVIQTAVTILPDLNRIVFDCWGHYVGHQVCLPMKMDAYQQLKKQKSFEGYLKPEKMSGIADLDAGVFLYYSLFAAGASAAYPLIMNSIRYLAKLEEKERYLVAFYSATMEVMETFENLGMRKVWRNTRNHEHLCAEVVPTMYEIELDVMMRIPGPFGGLGWIFEEYDKRARNLSNHSLIVDNSSSIVDNPKWNNPKGGKTQLDTLEKEACLNIRCTLYGKTDKANIVSNGTYRTKDGLLSRRFLCKECGESFCSRAGTIFYDLRSPEERVLKALNLLAKGMPLQGVAKFLGVRFNTVRRWLEIAAEQGEKIDAMLLRERGVSKAELDTLWTFVKENTLHKRAILWKTQKT